MASSSRTSSRCHTDGAFLSLSDHRKRFLISMQWRVACVLDRWGQLARGWYVASSRQNVVLSDNYHKGEIDIIEGVNTMTNVRAAFSPPLPHAINSCCTPCGRPCLTAFPSPFTEPAYAPFGWSSKLHHRYQPAPRQRCPGLPGQCAQHSMPLYCRL